MKGRVVVQREWRKPLEVEEYEVPESEPGAVLVRMTQTGMCGSDLQTWRGDGVASVPPSGRVGELCTERT